MNQIDEFFLGYIIFLFRNFEIFFIFYRTPWCVAFHPSHKDLLASGCLGGHVRIWDLNGGSELWTTDSVIASLAFHPVERLLVIATLNELHFWDWSHRKEDQNSKDPRPSRPFCKVSTKSDKEKVRYVKFDSFGHHLITGTYVFYYLQNLEIFQSSILAFLKIFCKIDLQFFFLQESPILIMQCITIAISIVQPEVTCPLNTESWHDPEVVTASKFHHL